MKSISDTIEKRVEELKATIAKTHSHSDVQIIAVTKYQPLEVFESLFIHGIRHVGESRVMEALRRKSEVPYPFVWHLIGSLQKNKVAKAICGFDYIHSIDSIELLQAVSDAVPKVGLKDKQKVFLQVNPVQESSKHGFTLDELDHAKELIYHMREMPYVEICGLMSMAPKRDQYGDSIVKEAFSKTAALFTTLKNSVFKDSSSTFSHLSMGMTQDYDIALEYGADFLRVGTFLFDEK